MVEDRAQVRVMGTCHDGMGWRDANVMWFMARDPTMNAFQRLVHVDDADAYTEDVDSRVVHQDLFQPRSGPYGLCCAPVWLMRNPAVSLQAVWRNQLASIAPLWLGRVR